MFSIEFTPEAVEDLARFRKFDQARIVAEIESQLCHEPTLQTRQRKRLRPNRLAEWELRVGTFRVFYDAIVPGETKTIRIVAIGVKEGDRLSVHGETFEL